MVDEGDLRFRNPPPDVYFPLHLEVLECLGPELRLPKRLVTSRDRAWRRTVCEDSIDAGFAHLVVAFGIDQEAHMRVEVARRFTYDANV